MIYAWLAVIQCIINTLLRFLLALVLGTQTSDRVSVFITGYIPSITFPFLSELVSYRPLANCRAGHDSYRVCSCFALCSPERTVSCDTPPPAGRKTHAHSTTSGMAAIQPRPGGNTDHAQQTWCQHVRRGGRLFC